MSNLFAPQQQGQQQMQGQDQSNFMTKDEFYSYVRSDSFRSVMKNQNSDLYKVGEWQKWNPVLRCDGDDLPLLDVGAQQLGSYTRIGNTVMCTFSFHMTHYNAASSGLGALYVELPVMAGTVSLPSRLAGVSPYQYVFAQSFQGTFFLEQWSNPITPGLLGWGHAAIATDVDTGDVVAPTRLEFWMGHFGYLGSSGGSYNPFNGEPIIDQLTFADMRKVEYSWPMQPSPTTSSVISGQVTYEAKPNVN